MTIPPGCRTLTDALTLNGWSYSLKRIDAGPRAPYIDVEAYRGTENVAVAWHATESGAQFIGHLNGAKATRDLVACMAETLVTA